MSGRGGTPATLGQHQLKLLMGLGTPTRVHRNVGKKVAPSLLQRGLLEPAPAGGVRITPAGLRALADALETGRLVPFIDR
jgi:hypothetical protein